MPALAGAVQRLPSRLPQRARRRRFLPVLGAALVLALVLAAFLARTGSESAAEAQRRERALAFVLTTTGRRAQIVDRRFQHFESLLARLAGAAEQALAVAPPSPRVFLEPDFADTNGEPADLQRSPRYGMRVSLDWPVAVLPPGSIGGKPPLALRRLLSIRSALPGLVLSSAGQPALVPSEDSPPRPSPPLALDPTSPAARLRLREGDLPLVRLWVGLEDGSYLAWPGRAGLPDEFDPRTLPAFRQAVESRGPHWGDPHRDPLGQGVLLPCSRPLRDAGGALLGVAGFELSLSWLEEDYLFPAFWTGARRAFLLDDTGHVVLDHGEAAPAGSHAAFPDAVIRRAARTGRTGYRTTSFDGTPTLLVYHHLETVGWTWVVAGDPLDSNPVAGAGP